ncbi:GDSL-type esterase/lipase family protein [Actinocrispum wychmicini]|uniref:GDSL-like lipase/acylhydrolase family protein n=1 Tax=Actinocrispum wychmicini TaxID=1213861 RepID=A0A4R2J7G1_9PSEU|nr:GDSL-type esterase/lipase family protein [Actinocrispum wychmicini]TCO53562.1 GDSL-like lipase/acylhydrolase family protein [Actinocrispum wychmicini]
MRRWRWHLTALAGLLVVAVVVFFVFGGDQQQTPTPQARPPENVPRVLVALGDSTVSGEGAGDYEPGTNGENGDWCHRSRDASIHHTDVPDVDATISLACSGANSAQIGLGDVKQYTEPSQAGRLGVVARQNRVVAVQVAVGANDDPSFAHSLDDCVTAWFDRGKDSCSRTLGAQWQGRVDAMVPKVTKVLADIRKVMTAAGYENSDYRLVLQSYASPIAPDIAGGLQNLSGCPFRTEDLRWVRETAVPTLTAGLRKAAEQAGANFLDLSQAGAGHEACSSTDPGKEWFRRLAVQWSDLRAQERADHALQESFHPNGAGYAQIGRCFGLFVRIPGLRAASCVAGPDGNLTPVLPSGG